MVSSIFNPYPFPSQSALNLGEIAMLISLVVLCTTMQEDILEWVAHVKSTEWNLNSVVQTM